MRDRTDFMNTLGEPNCGENIPSIFDKHYFKFNYAYNLFENFLDFPEIEDGIKKIESDQDDTVLSITVSFKKSVDMDKVMEIVEEFLSEKNERGIEGSVSRQGSNKINISITANFIEEEMYDDIRPDSDSEVYNGQ